jgi:uncharacterized repeat protein (TIGR04076 family)
MELGEKFVFGGLKTPGGVCVKAYAALNPFVAAMRFSDKTQWEKGKNYCDVVCPDGGATYRLSRIQD